MTKQLSGEDQKLIEAAFRSLKNVQVPEPPHLSMSDILKDTPISPFFSFNFAPVLVTVSLILVLSIFLFPQASWNPVQYLGSKEVPTSGLIQSVSGEARLVRGINKEPAQAGTFVEEGTEIKTGHGSKLYVRAGEDTSFILEDVSELNIDRLRINPETQSKHITLSLPMGHILCRLDQLEFPTSLTIMTPEAKFRVAGTQFELVRSPKDGSVLNVYQGTVTATPKGRGAKPISIEEGFQARIMSGTPPVVKSLVQETGEAESGSEAEAASGTGNQEGTKALPLITDIYEEK